MTKTNSPEPSRRLIPALVPLFVGGLLGFIGGYFAAGGGQPGGNAPGPEAAAQGDRLRQIRKEIERDPRFGERNRALVAARFSIARLSARDR